MKIVINHLISGGPQSPQAGDGIARVVLRGEIEES